MAEPALLNAQITHLRDFFYTAFTQFQNSEDSAGIETLLTAATQLENLVETDRNLQQPQINLNRLLPDLRKLYFYIQNQDITGITDLLEYTFYPLTQKWLEGSGDT